MEKSIRLRINSMILLISLSPEQLFAIHQKSEREGERESMKLRIIYSEK